MTDKQYFIKFLKKFKIPYHIGENEIIIRADDEDIADTITGYMHFFNMIEFDSEGNFKKIGIWE